MHFWLTQASFKEHSVLETHSGLQVGGEPMYPGTQEHTAWLFISLHWLFGPHGEGLQGFLGTSAKKKFINMFVLKGVGNKLIANIMFTWYW